MGKFYSVFITKKVLKYLTRSFVLMMLILGINILFFYQPAPATETINTEVESIKIDNLKILGFTDKILKWIENINW